MKIALIGADGQLGSELARILPRRHELLPLYYPDFDVTRREEVRARLAGLKPDMVINTAAFNRVDECEDNPRAAFSVNAAAVGELALAALDLGFILVHFSTDYVFDGEKGVPYVEDDPALPINTYGLSKLAGELFVRGLLKKYFLIRTCGLYGTAGSREKGYNFVDRMIALARENRPLRVVDDQWVTPTAAADLAEAVAELIETPHFGLFHLTNEGQCTWLEFAREIFRLTGLQPRLEAVDSASFGSRARRPRYSVLENRRAKSLGLKNLAPWPVALKRYLEERRLLAAV